MAIKKTVKNPPPPKVKPKTGTGGKTQTQTLGMSQGYLAAQAQSPVGAQIAEEAAALKAAREAVILRDEELANLQAELDKKKLELLTAGKEHDTAIENYAHRAGNIAKDDPTVLQGLGVEAAATQRAPHAEGPADSPDNLRVLPGPASGSSIVKWTRPAGAGAFLAQYRLESEAGGAPAADWVPADGFATKKVEWPIENLPPAAHLRVRVRAIGAEVGPWSEEVLGRAR
jgi:hypothetical protein